MSLPKNEKVLDRGFNIVQEKHLKIKNGIAILNLKIFVTMNLINYISLITKISVKENT